MSRWRCLGGISAPMLSMGRNPAFGHSSSPSILNNQYKTQFIAIPTSRNVKQNEIHEKFIESVKRSTSFCCWLVSGHTQKECAFTHTHTHTMSREKTNMADIYFNFWIPIPHNPKKGERMMEDLGVMA